MGTEGVYTADFYQGSGRNSHGLYGVCDEDIRTCGTLEEALRLWTCLTSARTRQSSTRLLVVKALVPSLWRGEVLAENVHSFNWWDWGTLVKSAAHACGDFRRLDLSSSITAWGTQPTHDENFSLLVFVVAVEDDDALRRWEEALLHQQLHVQVEVHVHSCQPWSLVFFKHNHLVNGVYSSLLAGEEELFTVRGFFQRASGPPPHLQMCSHLLELSPF